MCIHTILNVAIKGIHGKYYLNDKVAFWNINLYTAGSGGDLFILTIKIEMNEKKAIRFILQCSNSSYRRKTREHFLSKSISTSFALHYSQFKYDKCLPFSGSGSRSKLEQRLQHPLDCMPLYSELIVVWMFSARSLAYNSDWRVVSWMCTLMSCFHRLVPTQTFVKSSPYHTWSQRTMDKAHINNASSIPPKCSPLSLVAWIYRTQMFSCTWEWILTLRCYQGEFVLRKKEKASEMLQQDLEEADQRVREYLQVIWWVAA